MALPHLTPVQPEPHATVPGVSDAQLVSVLVNKMRPRITSLGVAVNISKCSVSVSVLVALWASGKLLMGRYWAADPPGAEVP